MNDCPSALAILRQARDILAQRLIERVLEMREELLDDAQGLTYSGEIDAIYDQIAVRLQHVNVMISNLPAEPPLPMPGLSMPAEMRASGPIPGSRAEPLFQAELAQADMVQAAERDSYAVLGDPAPFETTALPAPVTFELFVRQIAEEDIESAARSLAILFAVDEALGRRCAVTFERHWRQSPEILGKAVQLRRELQSGGVQGALRLLGECFGLQGIESVGVMQTLKARLVGVNEAL